MRRLPTVLLALAAATPLTAAPPGPVLRVTATYPGASPHVVEDAVAAPLFLAVNGGKGVAHVWTECRHDRAELTLYLKAGADPLAAQARILEAVTGAQAGLPELVRRHGVTVTRAEAAVLWLALTSPDGSRPEVALGAAAALEVLPALARLEGVRDVALVGATVPELRLWLDPEKLAAFGLTAGDVARAFEGQRAQAAEGPPGGPGLVFRSALGADEAGGLVVKVPGDRLVRLRDVARVEAGVGAPDGRARVGAAPAVVVVVSGDEAAGRRVSEALPALRKKLPEGMALAAAADRAAGGLVRAELRGPASASEERMEKVAVEATRLLGGVDGVAVAFAVARPGEAELLLRLDPAAVRRQGRDAVLGAVRKKLATIEDAACRLADPQADGLPPPRRFPLTLLVQAEVDEGARRRADRLAEALSGQPAFVGVFADCRRPVPQLSVSIDRAKAAALGVAVADIQAALRAVTGDARLDLGRGGPVRLVLPQVRQAADDLKRLKVRNGKGDMVPLGAVIDVQEALVAPVVTCLDGRRTVLVTAELAPGADAAAARQAARDAVERLADRKAGRVLLWGAGLDDPEDLEPRR